MRRPLRYGSSLKRGSLASTLNKMPGPMSIAQSAGAVRTAGSIHPSLISDGKSTTTVNITWPPEEDGNGTGSFVLQVRLDGQQQQTQQPTDQFPSQSGDQSDLSSVGLGQVPSSYLPQGSIGRCDLRCHLHHPHLFFSLLIQMQSWITSFSLLHPFYCTRQSKAPDRLAGARPRRPRHSPQHLTDCKVRKKG